MFKRIPAVIALISFLAVASVTSLGLVNAPQLAHAQDPEQWSRALPISGALSGSWYPSLAVQDDGTVHAIWGVTQDDSTLYYSKYDGLGWSRPVDILIGGPRSQLVLDGRNLLHVMYNDAARVVVADSLADLANTPQGWNSALQLNRTKAGTMGELRVDESGTLHAVWFEKQEGPEGIYQAVYGQSMDSGRSWELVRDLSQTNVAPRAMQLARASAGTMYALWSTSEEGRPDALALSVSTDNGDSWSEEPTLITDEREGIRQPALAVDANDNLVLIYNLGVKDETFFQTSTDRGATWSERAPIPGLFAQKTATGNDYFAIARDSANALHLIAVGRESKTQELASVYHLKWDGQTWTGPALVYQADRFIELPAIAIANGNQLHVMFSTRDRYRISGDPDTSYQVWYTSLLTDAAVATSVPLPSLTPTSTSTPTTAPSSTPTRRPTITPEFDGGAISTTNDSGNVNPQLPIIMGVGAVVGILVVVFGINFIARRRR